MSTSAVTRPVLSVVACRQFFDSYSFAWVLYRLQPDEMCENLADALESSLFGCMPKQAESFSHLHPVQFSFGDARLGLRSKALGCAFYATDVG